MKANTSKKYTREFQENAVRLALLADLDRLSPYPIRESAVELLDDANVDLATRLDRGRVQFSNQKKTGTATIRVETAK